MMLRIPNTADALTSGIPSTATIATIEMCGRGVVTFVMMSEESDLNTVKRPNGRRDYNKTLKGPCQLHPKSNHTMEEYRVLKNIYTQRAA